MDWLTSVTDFISGCWQWMVDLIKTTVNALLMPLAEAIPDMSFQAAKVQEYLGYANKWIALDYGLGLLISWFVFIIMMIAVKLIVKLFVPTVG